MAEQPKAQGTKGPLNTCDPKKVGLGPTTLYGHAPGGRRSN
jgi:hypothetical protein